MEEITDNFIKKHYVSLIKVKNFNINQIMSSDLIWYDYNSKKVTYILIRAGEVNEIQSQELFKVLSNKREECCSDMLVLIIFDDKNNKTYEYYVTNDCIKEVIRNEITSIDESILPIVELKYLESKTMEQKIERIVKSLTKQNKTITTMESCTGGQLASEITNIEGASEVLKESYITYCNEAKVKFGVQQDIINKYTVYSAETAMEMADAAKKMSNSDIGVGITGQLGRVDPNNIGNAENNTAWYAISKKDNSLVSKVFILKDLARIEKKKIVIREIVDSLYCLL